MYLIQHVEMPHAWGSAEDYRTAVSKAFEQVNELDGDLDVRSSETYGVEAEVLVDGEVTWYVTDTRAHDIAADRAR